MRAAPLVLAPLLALAGCATSGAPADRQRAAEVEAEAEAFVARFDSLSAVPGAPGSLAPADSAWLAEAPARFDSLRAEYAGVAPVPGRWSTGTVLLVSGALLAGTLLAYVLNPAH